jgi:pilus assembly protein CpaF
VNNVNIPAPTGPKSGWFVAPPDQPAAPPVAGAAPPEAVTEFDRRKGDLHAQLVNTLNLQSLFRLPADRQRPELHGVLVRAIAAMTPPLGPVDQEKLARELLDDILGFGPLEPLLRDPATTDILVNGAKEVYVERGGRLELTPVTFRDNDHVLQVLDRIVSRVGRRIDESSPTVDARLPDGSRVNAVISPVSVKWPCISIRRFGGAAKTLDDLIGFGMLPAELAAVLQACVRARLNVVISGGTGSGKTTLLNSLSRFIPGNERVVTIEDACELQLQQRHVVTLETRPPNVEGKGAITTRDLVRNALRMRPDRIVVGECRGGEALDMLQAMNTGHDGSMTTLHANTPRDVLSRLETMILMAGYDLPVRAMRQQIAAAVDLIIQTARLQGGVRKVTAVTEVLGLEQDTVTLQDLFVYEQTGVGPTGKAVGRFRATGVRPSFIERFQAAGCPVAADLFAERVLGREG